MNMKLSENGFKACINMEIDLSIYPESVSLTSN